MNINPNEIVISTFNTSKSQWFPNNDGITITHIPTGLKSSCSQYCSQHKNRNIAFENLKIILNKELEGNMAESVLDELKRKLKGASDALQEVEANITRLEMEETILKNRCDDLRKAIKALWYKDSNES